MQEFTASQYLMIDIANNFGLDKLTWNERLDWFNDNKNNLHNLVQEADEPALFYAGIKAYEDYLAKRPSGYMISLDATASGMQLLACLTGDRSAAKLCNVILDFSDKAVAQRMDGYTVIYNLMLSVLGEKSKIKRDDVKKAIMTALYGSQAQPKEIFGEGPLLDLFYEIMQYVAPAAWDLNEAMVNFWNPEALSNDWVLPDNFHVKCKVMNTFTEKVHFLNEPFDVFFKENAPTETGRSLGPNMVHSIDGMVVREITRRCDYDPARLLFVKGLLELPVKGQTVERSLTYNDKLVATLWNHYEQSGYLSARIVDHLNADNIHLVDVAVIRELLNSFAKKPFKVIAVHDCFRVHPNYGNEIRRQYNMQLHLIGKSKMLDYILSQITGREIKTEKLDPTMADEILNAEYALS
jgi:hypothetical protein